MSVKDSQTERITRWLDMACERRDELIEDRRKNPEPNMIRAQELAALTAEISIYTNELRHRGVEA